MLSFVESWVLVRMLHRLLGRAVPIILQALDLLVRAVGRQARFDKVVVVGLVVAVLFIRAGRNQAHIDFLLMCIVFLEFLLLTVPRLLLERLDDGDALSFVPLADDGRNFSCLLLRGRYSQGWANDRCIDCLDLGLALCGQVHIYVRVLRCKLLCAVNPKIVLLGVPLGGPVLSLLRQIMLLSRCDGARAPRGPPLQVMQRVHRVWRPPGAVASHD